MAAGLDPLPQVVVLAGGWGRRLDAALPSTIPKVLAPVDGRAFLHFVFELLAIQGVSRVHLCLGHGAPAVLEFLGHGQIPALDVTTSIEPSPLGTAGALRAAADHLDDEFLLLLGDTYTPIDLGDLVQRHRLVGAEASMAVLRNRDWLVTSNVSVDEGLVGAYLKSSGPGVHEWVDYGVAVLARASLVRLSADDPVDLHVLFQSLIQDRQLAALPVGTRFYEIGTPASYADFIDLAREGALPVKPVRWRPSIDVVEAARLRAPVKHRLSSRTRFRSPWMSVREDTVLEPDGAVAPFAVVTRSDSVVALCRSAAGELLMTYQYRYAIGRWSLELPQGERKPGETFAQAAQRELAEETGWAGVDAEIVAERMHEAGDWATQSFAVVAMRLRDRDRTRLDSTETSLSPRWVKSAELPELVLRGEVSDAATLAALWLEAAFKRTVWPGAEGQGT